MKPKAFYRNVVLSALLMCGMNLRAQNIDSLEQIWNNKLDSMLLVIAKAEQDTSLAKLYFDIGELYFDNEPLKAEEYYLKLNVLSEKLGWNRGRYLFAMGITNVLNNEGLMDSAIIINQQVLELVKKEGNELEIANLSINIGINYHYKRWYETALNYYGEALSILDRRGDKFRIAQLYSLMAALYGGELNMQDENLIYCKKALNILNEKPDTLIRANALIHFAIALADRNEFERAEDNFFEAQRISQLHNSKYMLSIIYINLGNLALKKFDLEKAEAYIRKSLEISNEFGMVESDCISYRLLSKVELYRGHFDKSEVYAKKSLDISNDYDLPKEKMGCYHHLSDLAMARHDFHNQQIYRAKADSIERTLAVEKARIYSKEMETRYETEKKELKISALEEEKRLTLWLGLVTGAALLLALAFFIVRQRLTQQKVARLEQEKQLVATQALLDGETAERTRLARDLHDGLGGMLSVVKLNLNDMKNGVSIESEDVLRFNRVVGLLDESIRELRRVAHNMMPDSLTRYGLRVSLNDFCSSIPGAVFSHYGGDERLDPKLEVMIYRTVHELVNNALKHANATEIIVQMIQEHDRVSITVQDDGHGFDPAAPTSGTGLHNIRNRVGSYNGRMDVYSEPGKGTEISVEFKL